MGTSQRINTGDQVNTLIKTLAKNTTDSGLTPLLNIRSNDDTGSNGSITPSTPLDAAENKLL